MSKRSRNRGWCNPTSRRSSRFIGGCKASFRLRLGRRKNRMTDGVPLWLMATPRRGHAQPRQTICAQGPLALRLGVIEILPA
jgi:hypothetical protein